MKRATEYWTHLHIVFVSKLILPWLLLLNGCVWGRGFCFDVSPCPRCDCWFYILILHNVNRFPFNRPDHMPTTSLWSARHFIKNILFNSLRPNSNAGKSKRNRQCEYSTKCGNSPEFIFIINRFRFANKFSAQKSSFGLLWNYCIWIENCRSFSWIWLKLKSEDKRTQTDRLAPSHLIAFAVQLSWYDLNDFHRFSTPLMIDLTASLIL